MLCLLPGKQEAVEATLVALEVVAEPLKSMATILVDVCAYAGEFFASVSLAGEFSYEFILLSMQERILSEKCCK